MKSRVRLRVTKSIAEGAGGAGGRKDGCCAWLAAAGRLYGSSGARITNARMLQEALVIRASLDPWREALPCAADSAPHAPPAIGFLLKPCG